MRVAEVADRSTGHARRRSRSALLALLALLALTALAPRHAAAAEAPPFWSGPISIDPGGGSFTGLSCVASLCLALDGEGNLLGTAQPVGRGGEWTRTGLSGGGYGAVSCAGASLCALVGGGTGSVEVSSDPLGGSSTWSQEAIDPEGPVSALACTLPSLCVAGDERGDMLSSTAPGTAKAWLLKRVVAHSEAIAGVSCASESLCVAVDGGGKLLVSSEPAGDEWTPIALPWPPPRGSNFAVSCVAGPLCVIGGDHAVFASSEPAAGASAWSEAANVDAGGGVSCTAPSRCVAFAGDASGGMVASEDPLAGAGSWVGDDAGQLRFSHLSCGSPSVCVATTGREASFSTTAYPIKVAIAGGGHGKVQSTPAACPFLSCSREARGGIQPQPLLQLVCGDPPPFSVLVGTCELGYPKGGQTTLTATPEAGSLFAGWSGACAGGTLTCTLGTSQERAATATFSAVRTGPAPARMSRPRLTGLRESNRVFAPGSSRTALRGETARRTARGTVFRFTLNGPASVAVAIEAALPGGRVAGRCELGRKPSRSSERCPVFTRVARLERGAFGGPNALAFSGRIGTRALRAGYYRARFRARNSAGSSATQQLTFTVLSR